MRPARSTRGGEPDYREKLDEELRQMRESGLVTVDEDNHIHLTEEGRAIATHIYERHTILSQLLMRLGVTKETALHDACKIEHDLSDETFDAIKRHFQAHQETNL